MNSSIYGYLTTFHHIVNEGSIAAAARKLDIASPSVSNALKSLEQHIGLPLIHRTTRKMELTDAGLRLYENTKNALQALDIAVETVQDLRNVPSGLVRITLSDIAYDLVLKPYFAEFCERYPEIQLEISINNGTVDIIKEGFDLGIRPRILLEDTMVARKLIDAMELGLYASQKYVQQYGIPTKLSDLKQHKFVGFRFSNTSQLYPLILVENDNEVEIQMATPLIVNTLENIIEAVRKGVAIGRIFTASVQQQLDKEDFVPLLPQHWREIDPLYLYYTKNSLKAMRVRVFVDFLLEKLSAH